MEKHLSHMEEFEKNQAWLQTHLPRLLKKYRNLFIAVWNQDVIDKDDTLENLTKRIHKKFKNSKGIYVQYITDKPMEMIL